MIPDSNDCIRPLAGATDRQRGASVELHPPTFPCSGCDSVELAILQLRNGCRQGESLNVTLGITTVPKTVAEEGPEDDFASLALPRAVIEWGCGDANLTAVVDFVTGTGVNVVTEGLRVSARYDVYTPPWEDCPTEECLECLPVYRATALVGYGGPCRGPTYREVAFILVDEEGTGKALVRIPPFASSFTILPVGEAAVTARILPCSRAFGVDDVIITPLSNVQQTNSIDQIPVFGSSRWIEIENTSEESSDNSICFVVFALSL